MPLYQETTYHDIQNVANGSSQVTSSTDFVDVPGAVITTNDLSVPSDYMMFFSILVQSSLNNTMASFRLLVNSIPFSELNVSLVLKIKEQDVGYTFMGVVRGIVAGDVLQMQWKTDKGILNLSRDDLMVNGTPSSRII